MIVSVCFVVGTFRDDTSFMIFVFNVTGLVVDAIMKKK